MTAAGAVSELENNAEWQRFRAEIMAWIDDPEIKARMESAAERHKGYRELTTRWVAEQDDPRLASAWKIIGALLDDLEDTRKTAQILIYDLTAANASIRNAAGVVSCVWCEWRWKSDIDHDYRRLLSEGKVLENIVDADEQARITRERTDSAIAAIKLHVTDCPNHPMRELERRLASLTP